MPSLADPVLPYLPGVHTPGYSRAAVRPGIAHIGLGAFARAHLGCFIDRCLHDPDQQAWGLLGIHLRAQDEALARSLGRQHGLYTLTERGDGADAPRLIGAVVETAYAPVHDPSLSERLTDPALHIVSLTITEGGYRTDTEEGPMTPRSAFGYLAQALWRRRSRGIAPFTVLSCDNLRHNGAAARQALVTAAARHTDEFAAWTERTVAFPNSMVDRITPATTDAHRRAVETALGATDAVPVVCEPYLQWVLEDRFVDGRPALERHGVQLVGDVAPYEEAKIRLLNAAHEMLCFPAFLAGYRRVDQAVEDPALAHYLRGFLFEEALPFLHSPPGMDLNRYAEQLLLRLRNAEVGDQLARLCGDAGSKVPGFLGPTLTACLHAGRDARRIAFLLACLWRFLTIRRDDAGEVCPLEEPNAMPMIQAIATAASPGMLLDCAALVGAEAGRDERFRAQYLSFVAMLERHGVRQTLDRL